MFYLLLFSGLFTGFFIYKKIKYIFYPTLTFEDSDTDEDDEYNLLNFDVIYKNEEKESFVDIEDLNEEFLDKLNIKNKIDYVIINYMYNGKFMKYITYEFKVDFPIYDLNINMKDYEYPKSFILNNYDLTGYIKPFLGPKYNFYADKTRIIKLKDILKEYPDLDKLNLEEGILDIYTSKDRKVTIELPWPVNWKPKKKILDNKSEDLDYNRLIKQEFVFID
tara:strand:- start:5091 stop:5753 length:663 start_codon:yes stop_codon:yes gene_type:complete